MKRLSILAFSISLSVALTSLGSLAQAQSFSEDLAASRAGRAELSESELAYFRQFHFELVTGFMGDHSPGYFEGQAKFLRDNGISVSITTPDSRNGVLENARIIGARHRAEASKRGKKTIYVAHSKAVAETMRALIDEEERANSTKSRSFIHALVGIEGVLNEHAKLDPIVDKKGVRIYSNLPPAYQDAGRTLAGKYLRPVIEDKLSTLPIAALERVASKVYYVLGSADPADPARGTTPGMEKITANGYREIAANGAALNDGFVGTKNQIIPGIGVALGMIQENHLRPVKDLAYAHDLMLPILRSIHRIEALKQKSVYVAETGRLLRTLKPRYFLGKRLCEGLFY